MAHLLPGLGCGHKDLSVGRRAPAHWMQLVLPDPCALRVGQTQVVLGPQKSVLVLGVVWGRPGPCSESRWAWARPAGPGMTLLSQLWRLPQQPEAPAAEEGGAAHSPPPGTFLGRDARGYKESQGFCWVTFPCSLSAMMGEEAGETGAALAGQS